MADGCRTAGPSCPPFDGSNNPASISTPPALLYLMNSGATTAIDDHFSLNFDSARAGASGVFIHNSGASVAVSPTNTNVPDDVRANDDGLTSMPVTAVALPRRSTTVTALLKPRAVLTASD